MFRINVSLLTPNPRSLILKINNVCFCLQFFGLKTAQARVVKHIFYTIYTEYGRAISRVNREKGTENNNNTQQYFSGSKQCLLLSLYYSL